VPNVSKVTALTGWRAERDLDHVLGDVIDEARSEMSARPAG